MHNGSRVNQPVPKRPRCPHLSLQYYKQQSDHRPTNPPPRNRIRSAQKSYKEGRRNLNEKQLNWNEKNRR